MWPKFGPAFSKNSVQFLDCEQLNYIMSFKGQTRGTDLFVSVIKIGQITQIFHLDVHSKHLIVNKM